MPGDTILVIDAGTSAMRAVAVRQHGETRAVAREQWAIRVPDDAAPFGRELDAVAVEGALRRLLAQSQHERARVAGIALTGQREGLAFLDDDGTPVYLGPNVDARASAEGIAIDAEHGDAVYATTGHLPSLMQAPAKLGWLRNNRPKAAADVRRVAPLADWLASLLTGELHVSATLAAENGLLDIRPATAAWPLLKELGMTADVPDVVRDGAVTGAVTDGAFAGVPVVVAGADTQCALLGCGAEASGDAAVVAGWSAPVQLVTGAPVFDAERRTWTSLHVAPDRWILESNAGEAGRAWEWLCSMMSVGPTDGDVFAAAAPAGARDVLAVLGPRVMRAASMNAGVGALTMPLPLVMSMPGRAEVARATLEAIAFAIRANLEQLEEVSGSRIERLSAGGGMCRSDVFMQIVADVIDRPFEVARSPETTALGAAVLAAASLGLHASLANAVRTMTSPRHDVIPCAASSAVYEDCYARWCAMADEFERIATEIG